MSFIKNNLKNGENLIFQSSQSIKSLFFWTFIFAIIGFADFFVRAEKNITIPHQVIIAFVIFSFIKNFLPFEGTKNLILIFIFTLIFNLLFLYKISKIKDQ